MKAATRQAAVAAPGNGLRREPRPALAIPATLHIDGAEPLAVTITDLSPHGCRVAAAGDLRVAAYVALMLGGTSLISGRVAWTDGTAIGVDFCTPLLPRIVRRLGTPGLDADRSGTTVGIAGGAAVAAG